MFTTPKIINSLTEGSRVKADWRKGGQYHTGKISHVRIDGYFDITYDDGDVEEGVSIERIRILADKNGQTVQLGIRWTPSSRNLPRLAELFFLI
jgi:hypothetical protein